MEIRLGITHIAREVIVESSLTPEEVSALVRTALADPRGLLTLTDDRGRTVVVPGSGLAYVEMGPPSARRVGFAG